MTTFDMQDELTKLARKINLLQFKNLSDNRSFNDATHPAFEAMAKAAYELELASKLIHQGATVDVA